MITKGNNIETHFNTFLGAFEKLWKATISFVMSVGPSVRKEKLCSHWTYFHELWYLRIFRKSVEKIQVSLNSDKNNWYFTWRPIFIFLSSRSFLSRMRNSSDKSCRGNQNTHFVSNNFFFSKIVPFKRNCGKVLHSRTGHRWQYDARVWHAGYLRLKTHTQNM
jgi:hypothetical protein